MMNMNNTTEKLLFNICNNLAKCLISNKTLDDLFFCSCPYNDGKNK